MRRRLLSQSGLEKYGYVWINTTYMNPDAIKPVFRVWEWDNGLECVCLGNFGLGEVGELELVEDMVRPLHIFTDGVEDHIEKDAFGKEIFSHLYRYVIPKNFGNDKFRLSNLYLEIFYDDKTLNNSIFRKFYVDEAYSPITTKVGFIPTTNTILPLLHCLDEDTLCEWSYYDIKTSMIDNTYNICTRGLNDNCILMLDSFNNAENGYGAGAYAYAYDSAIRSYIEKNPGMHGNGPTSFWYGSTFNLGTLYGFNPIDVSTPDSYEIVYNENISDPTTGDIFGVLKWNDNYGPHYSILQSPSKNSCYYFILNIRDSYPYNSYKWEGASDYKVEVSNQEMTQHLKLQLFPKYLPPWFVPDIVALGAFDNLKNIPLSINELCTDYTWYKLIEIMFSYGWCDHTYKDNAPLAFAKNDSIVDDTWFSFFDFYGDYVYYNKGFDNLPMLNPQNKRPFSDHIYQMYSIAIPLSSAYRYSTFKITFYPNQLPVFGHPKRVDTFNQTQALTFLMDDFSPFIDIHMIIREPEYVEKFFHMYNGKYVLPFKIESEHDVTIANTMYYLTLEQIVHMFEDVENITLNLDDIKYV